MSIAGEQPVDEPGGEGIASADAIEDLHVVPPWARYVAPRVAQTAPQSLLVAVRACEGGRRRPRCSGTPLATVLEHSPVGGEIELEQIGVDVSPPRSQARR